VSELQQRIVTGLILIAVALTLLWVGGNPFWVMLAGAGIIMMGEWARLVSAQTHARISQFAICIPIAIMAPMAAGPGFLALCLFFAAGLFLTLFVKNFALGAGALYIGLPMLSLMWMRELGATSPFDDQLNTGMVYAGWALTTVWATDIGAYFAGRAIGGPKIAPRISPNKTWAGLFGGMLGALLLGWIYSCWAQLPIELALMSPVLAVFAQAGDFFESWLKRRAGVKDSGTLLPGHGGLLDRLDGAVSSLPIAALSIFIVAEVHKPQVVFMHVAPIYVASCVVGADGKTNSSWQETCRKVRT
jgi:phosphatidate cytidylyltransferase